MFAVKLAVLSSLGEHPLLAPVGDLDGAYYLHFAQRVAAGDVWLESRESFFGQPPAPFFIAPLYIYALALFLKIGGGALETARFLQIVLGTVAVGLIAATARRWYGTLGGWCAGALAALCGLFTFYEILILQASLEPFLTALALYLLTRALETVGEGTSFTGRSATVRIALAGAAFGLHALNRPNMLIVFAGMALLLAAPAGRRVARVGAFVLAGLIVIAPATIRNWRVSGELVLIASHGGLNFLIGNGPEADGTFRRVMNIEPTVRGQWIDAPRVVREATGREAGPTEVSRFFYRQAFDWIREHPHAWLRLMATKLSLAMSSTFLTLNHSFPFFARDIFGPLSFLIIGPAVIVPLGLVGLVVARPNRRGYLIWAAYVPLALLSVVLFFVAARYRLPFQVALTTAAGGASAWAISRVRERDWRAVGPAAVLTGLFAAAVVWPMRINDGRAEEQTRMGLRLIQAGQTDQGEAWIARALLHHGFPGVVHLRVGQVYEAQGKPEEALRHYRAAQQLDPNELTVPFAMGRALFQQGKDTDAIVALERARSGPQRDAATRLLVLSLTRLGRHEEVNKLVHDLDPTRWTADQAREFALALTNVRRVDLSLTAWKRAADAGGDARDYERLGLAWILLKRPADALPAFDEAVKRAPNSANIRLNRAVTLAELGRRDEARREAEEALRLDPSYERAKQFLASLTKK